MITLNDEQILHEHNIYLISPPAWRTLLFSQKEVELDDKCPSQVKFRLIGTKSVRTVNLLRVRGSKYATISVANNPSYSGRKPGKWTNVFLNEFNMDDLKDLVVINGLYDNFYAFAIDGSSSDKILIHCTIDKKNNSSLVIKRCPMSEVIKEGDLLLTRNPESFPGVMPFPDKLGGGKIPIGGIWKKWPEKSSGLTMAMRLENFVSEAFGYGQRNVPELIVEKSLGFETLLNCTPTWIKKHARMSLKDQIREVYHMSQEDLMRCLSFQWQNVSLMQYLMLRLKDVKLDYEPIYYYDSDYQCFYTKKFQDEKVPNEMFSDLIHDTKRIIVLTDMETYEQVLHMLNGQFVNKKVFVLSMMV
jgi:hypothetical protein